MFVQSESEAKLMRDMANGIFLPKSQIVKDQSVSTDSQCKALASDVSFRFSKTITYVTQAAVLSLVARELPMKK